MGESEVAVVLDEIDRDPVLAAAGLLFAGIVVLVAFFVFVRRSKHGLCNGAFGSSLEEVAGTYELSYSPRSRPWPYRCADAASDPPGQSCVYWFAWTLVLLWLSMTTLWFLILYFDVELAVYRVERFARSAAYVAVALLLCALWIPLVQFGADGCDAGDDGCARRSGCRAPNLHMAALLAVVAYALAVAAEVELDPWTYPGPGLWIFVGVGYSLLSGWLGYAAWLTVGIAMSAAVRDRTARGWYSMDGANRFGSAKLFLATLFVTTPVALAVPSPGQPLWTLFVVLGFTPRYRWNVATSVLAALVLVGSVLRVVEVRNDLN